MKLTQKMEKPLKIDVYFKDINLGIEPAWIRQIAVSVFEEEGHVFQGTLSIVLVNDSTIQNLNRRFLQKNNPTDVIAFPLHDGDDDVWGEIYISTDRAKEQAEFYKVSFETELMRLVIHGTLHLIGYDDADEKSSGKMKEREDYLISHIISEQENYQS